MIRSVSARVGVLIAVITALNLLAGVVGARSIPHPAVSGFTTECADQPCWYGIVPGVTRLEEARELLEQQGWTVTRQDLLDYVRLEGVSPWGCRLLTGGSIGLNRNPKLESIPIVDCADLRLGDVLEQMGMPDRVSSCDKRFGPVPQFGGEVSVTLIDAKASSGWLSPFDRVERIHIVREAAFPIVLNWRGFAPAWRYQQLGGEATCG